MPDSIPEPAGPAKFKLLDQVRAILRTRHYSLRTEEVLGSLNESFAKAPVFQGSVDQLSIEVFPLKLSFTYHFPSDRSSGYPTAIFNWRHWFPRS